GAARVSQPLPHHIARGVHSTNDARQSTRLPLDTLKFAAFPVNNRPETGKPSRRPFPTATGWCFVAKKDRRPRRRPQSGRRAGALRPPLDAGERSKVASPGRRNAPRERDGLFDIVRWTANKVNPRAWWARTL